MALATLSIDLIAKTAQLERDMREAANIGRKGTEQIQDSLEGLKSYASNFLGGMAAGMAAAFSVSEIAQFIGANVEAADELNRLSQSTGVSVEKLSQWGAVARRNGLDVQDLSEQINEFQANLSDVSDDTEGAGYALKQLGLDYKSVKEMSSEDAFTAVAEALSKVEDSGKKAALSMALGGDEYQKYLPVLNAIGAGGLEVAAITQEQAQAAARYKDNLAELSIAGETWGQTVVGGIVPALDEAVRALIDVTAGTDGLTAEARALARDGTITEWARGGVTALTYLIDAGIYTGKVLSSIAKTAAAAAVQVVQSMAGIGDVAERVLAGDFSGAVDAAGAAVGRVKAAGQAWADDMEESWSERTLGAKIRDRISDIKTVGASAEAAAASAAKVKVKFDPGAQKAAKEAAKQASDEAKKLADAQQKALEEYEKLVTGIRTKTAADEAEAAGLAPLTEAQRSALEVMTQIRDGRLKLTETQKVNVTGYLEEAIAAEKAAESAKAYTAWMDESRNANADTLDQAIQQTAAIRDQLAALHLQAEEYGLSAEGVTALAQARKLDTARALESSAAAMAGLPGYERMTAEWQAQADAIRDVIKQQQIRIDLEGMDAKDPYKGARQGIKDYLQDISAASDAAKSVTTKMLGSVEDELTSLVTTGQFNFKSLINSMISEALRLSVVRPMMSAFLSSSAGAGTASLIGNMVSVGASFFGGVGSAGNAGFGDYSSAGMAAAFGGGRANGGPVGAGTLYDVNERGTPELLTVGSKTMLMMGAEGGRVTPLDNPQPLSGSSSAGASAPVIHQTFNFGGADTVTRAEMQRAAAAAKDAALAEWQNNRARGVRGYA